MTLQYNYIAIQEASTYPLKRGGSGGRSPPERCQRVEAIEAQQLKFIPIVRCGHTLLVSYAAARGRRIHYGGVGSEYETSASLSQKAS